jgi:hypothetical protein
MIAAAMFEVLETQAQLRSEALEVNVLTPAIPVVYALGGAKLG